MKKDNTSNASKPNIASKRLVERHRQASEASGKSITQETCGIVALQLLAEINRLQASVTELKVELVDCKRGRDISLESGERLEHKYDRLAVAERDVVYARDVYGAEVERKCREVDDLRVEVARAKKEEIARMESDLAKAIAYDTKWQHEVKESIAAYARSETFAQCERIANEAVADCQHECSREATDGAKRVRDAIAAKRQASDKKEKEENKA